MTEIKEIREKEKEWELTGKIFKVINILLIGFAIFLWRNKEYSFWQSSNVKVAEKNKLAISSQHGANLRKYPDKNAAVLYFIPYMTNLQISDTAYSRAKSKWYKVEYNSKTGWVWSKNVKVF